VSVLLTYRDIARHQAAVPWKRERQVEQDLLLCLAMRAIFTDGFLSGQVAMRGGTLLHKVHLAPAARYSEDIDLVVHGDRPEGHIDRALRRVLLPVLGKPVGFGWESVKLAVRNAVQPSRVLRLCYSVPNVSGDGPELEIVVEANVSERFSYLPVLKVPYAFDFRGERAEFSLNGYETHEMLGTKMRALFQRRRGRDLFDLYWALENSGGSLNSARVVECFLFYLEKEGGIAGREEFFEILDGHLADAGFCSDMEPLLRLGIDYDPQAAGRFVKERLLAFLPDKARGF
jgi:predicted nucleotidyltransferase component of viral defense system